MAINWSTIAGEQPKGGVVATLPNQPNQLDQGVSGLMQGLLQGQQFAASRQNMEAQKQQMDQSAQMFPSQLQSSQNAAASSSLDLQSKQQTFEDIQKQRAAFQQSYDAGVKALMQTPDGAKMALEMQQIQSQTKANLAQAANQMAESQSKANMAYTSMAATGAQLAMTANNAEMKQPGMGQQVWSQGLKMMPDSLAAQFPQEFNPGTAMVMTKLGNDAALDLKESQLSKNAPDIRKKQIERNRLEQKIQGGQGTDQDQRDLQELNQIISAQGRGQSPNQTDVAVGKADEQRLKDIQKQNASIPRHLQVIDNAEASLAKTPGQLLNPVAGYLKLAKLDPNGQALVSSLNDLTLTAKEQFNMGSQGFTDADRQFVQAINGDISNYKGTLKELLQRGRSLTEHAAAQNWLEEYNIVKKGSDSGAQWKESHPEPSVTIKLPDGRIGTIPVSNLDKAIKAKAVLQ